ncbi:MAG TPA: gamma-glutamyltransferase [Caulobacteraceae bacterium]|nr:gamma-glutamyltransferase [Caulobacteraceae bacterium]
MILRRLSALLLLALASCAPLPDLWPPRLPGGSAPGPAEGRRLVSAANPLAAEAGMAVLRRGGTAVDAAVAIQAVLSLTEPQSSGIGGGAFLMHYDARTGRVSAWDGREAAPRGANATMFLDEAGKPLPFAEAVVSGRATGVPGVIAMLAEVQGEHGRLPWRELFADAIAHAENGFRVSPRLSGYVNGAFPQTRRPDVVAYFTEADGTLVDEGDLLRNPAYGATLRRIAAEGPKAFYEGAVAREIVAAVGAAPRPGAMTLDDLKRYRPVKREPLCRPWRTVRIVCTMPPPSSGVALLQGLMLLEHTDIDRRGPDDAKAWLAFAEASRVMYADRDRYVGDPAFVGVPVEGLLDPAYVRARAALIGERAGPAPAPGSPAGAGERAPDRTREPAGTSHFVVADAYGNVVSMTTTVESLFGSGRMAGGFFLNNQMTDFSFSPVEKDGAPAANAVAPGKRPRSSMSPVIVLDEQGKVVAALGSPGGSAIVAYNLKTLVGLFDWKLSMQQSIDLPNLVARGSAFNGEAAKFPPETLAALKALGVEVKGGSGENSGLHGFVVRLTGLEGGADTRREGVVLVD